PDAALQADRADGADRQRPRVANGACPAQQRRRARRHAGRRPGPAIKEARAMLKKGTKRNGRQGALRGKGFLAALACLFFLAAAPCAAWAQCENPVTATSRLTALIRDSRSDLNDFITQESNFIDAKITETATDEMLARLEEF